jgi:hypothetical protein
MSEIKIKRKVTLKRKINTEESEIPKKRKYTFIFLLISVSVIGLLWFLNDNNSDHRESSTVIKEDTVISNVLSTPTPEKMESPKSQLSPIDAKIDSVDRKSNSSKNLIASNTHTQIKESQSSSRNSVLIGDASLKERSISPSRSNVVSSKLDRSLEEKAQQVIRGDFGNGNDRKIALGEEYFVIQAKVNEIYKSRKP